MYCTPKIHKKDTPLRPIVDYTGSIGYNTSRSLADLLGPLVGNTRHHVKNSKHLCEEMDSVLIEENEMFVSHDVVSLFTNTPIDRSLDIIRERLEKDDTLKERTHLLVADIMELLEFVLTTTYFSFRGEIYKQKFGTAMGSPVSPIIANLFMEYLEQQAIATAPLTCTPRLWKRYVDDILEIIKRGSVQQLTDHLNATDDTGSIKFTYEEESENSIPFLDTLIVRKQDGSLKVLVYRKKTHTDQYLHFTSHHPLQHKLGVIKTLLDRCETVVTESEDRVKEEAHIHEALKRCGYPDWTFRKVKEKKKKPPERKKSEDKDKSVGVVVIPYIKGTSECLQRVFRKHKVAVSMKPHQTLRSLLVHPKDKIDVMETCNCVYQVECKSCDYSYIGETGRKLKTRLGEHKKDVDSNTCRAFTRAERRQSQTELHKSAITDHVARNNHTISWEDTRVLDKESDQRTRQIREAIRIRTNKKGMNRDQGAYRLSQIYNPLFTAVASGNKGK